MKNSKIALIAQNECAKDLMYIAEKFKSAAEDGYVMSEHDVMSYYKTAQMAFGMVKNSGCSVAGPLFTRKEAKDVLSS